MWRAMDLVYIDRHVIGCRLDQQKRGFKMSVDDVADIINICQAPPGVAGKARHAAHESTVLDVAAQA